MELENTNRNEDHRGIDYILVFYIILFKGVLSFSLRNPFSIGKSLAALAFPLPYKNWSFDFHIFKQCINSLESMV